MGCASCGWFIRKDQYLRRFRHYHEAQRDTNLEWGHFRWWYRGEWYHMRCDYCRGTAERAGMREQNWYEAYPTSDDENEIGGRARVDRILAQDDGGWG